MADRYWVGGTANWDGTAGTKWALTPGGTGGQTVPTTADDVFFTSFSIGTCTISTGNTGAKSINCTGLFTGTITGTAAIIVAGSITLAAGQTYTHTGTVTITGTGTATLTTAGKTFSGVAVNGANITVTLGDALNTSARSLTVTNGTFDTNGYNVTLGSLNSSNLNTRAIYLGASTVTLSTGGTAVDFGSSSGLTFDAGTSQLNLTTGSATFSAPSVAFYNVSFTGLSPGTRSITSANTFNNLTLNASGIGLSQLAIGGNQTVSGTFTCAGSSSVARGFVRSSVIGTTRTITAAAVSANDCDFRDISIAGAAAPVSGTRFGDCKGNSGITFDAAKTVYWRSATAANWSDTAWAATNGGTAVDSQFPLAQDTAVFPSAYPSNGVAISLNQTYNIGTIDMSARTSNTMALGTSTLLPQIYGDWINGTGIVLSGTGAMTFAGQGSQTITSAGITFTQGFIVDTASGSVSLQDAFTSNRSATTAFRVLSGTFDADVYAFTLSGALSTFDSANSRVRTISIGSGTWTIAGSGTAWSTSVSTNLTVTGTGTINLTSASAKTFTGGSIQTFPTLNQGGTGVLTVVGSNKFAGLTNTAIGRIQFSGGTTNEFTSFNINGVSGNLLQLGSTNTTQAILKASSWNVGANSTDAGNNTGLSFTGTSPDYLSVSYINGQLTLAPTSTIFYGAANVTAIYYGSTPVTAIYYGATQVF